MWSKAWEPLLYNIIYIIIYNIFYVNYLSKSDRKTPKNVSSLYLLNKEVFTWIVRYIKVFTWSFNGYALNVEWKPWFTSIMKVITKLTNYSPEEQTRPLFSPHAIVFTLWKKMPPKGPFTQTFIDARSICETSLKCCGEDKQEDARGSASLGWAPEKPQTHVHRPMVRGRRKDRMAAPGAPSQGSSFPPFRWGLTGFLFLP